MRDELCHGKSVSCSKLDSGAYSSRYGCIGDVWGRGLIAGCEIVGDRKTKVGAPEIGKAVSGKLVEMIL
ncbi:hypothetical protein BDU57DRAFT_569544 [Ampelomyces quisqualis]|uniref:Uncharacterized protein n=1 Tax=Ampelomyces quisqualis TaxID=50730 RepID=A0A6A5QXX1_AMPQU|nr:hypothetical protein BDU57DRAFT_569544 [Ampelomyces quisqualis]